MLGLTLCAAGLGLILYVIASTAKAHYNKENIKGFLDGKLGRLVPKWVSWVTGISYLLFLTAAVTLGIVVVKLFYVRWEALL